MPSCQETGVVLPELLLLPLELPELPPEPLLELEPELVLLPPLLPLLVLPPLLELPLPPLLPVPPGPGTPALDEEQPAPATRADAAKSTINDRGRIDMIPVPRKG